MANKVMMSMVLIGAFVSASGQGSGLEKVDVQLTPSSDIVFTMRDRDDIPLLRDYNFQALFADILDRIEHNDTSGVEVVDSLIVEEVQEPVEVTTDDDLALTPDEEWGDTHSWTVEPKERLRTEESFNVLLGTSNYLSGGKFPDDTNAPYAVRPLGSWYVGLASTMRTRVGGKFFLEWGMGISWLNFKFQQDNVRVMKDNTSVIFLPDTASYAFKKSKLTATYLTASFVPMIDFNGSIHKPRFWDSRGAFRFGAGPYAGYRIGSLTKVVYKVEGDTKRDKDKGNPYLRNFSYGLRVQLGFRSTDLFLNYDLSPLFIEGKGPDLNAFTFGIIL